MKNQSQVRNNRLIRDAKKQRKSVNRREASPRGDRPPLTSPTARYLGDIVRAQDQAEAERLALLIQRVVWIERSGQPAVRLILSDYLGALVANALDDNALECIAEVIRHSRSMPLRRGTAFLRAFAGLLSPANPAGPAINRALVSKHRGALLDMVQLGDFARPARLV